MNDVANTQNIMGVELEYFKSLIQKLKTFIIHVSQKNKTLIVSIKKFKKHFAQTKKFTKKFKCLHFMLFKSK
jgi:hypothetical protein